MPMDWHYALHMKPNSLSLDQIMDVVDRVTPEMVRKTYFHGTPADIAAQIRPYVAGGANLHLIADLAPLLVPTEPEVTLRNSAEICRLVKGE
jgi:phthiodiolone/phenolphthiodiolone dimycocerosates ketoreductase